MSKYTVLSAKLLVKNLDRYMLIAFSNLIFLLMLTVFLLTSWYYYSTLQAAQQTYSRSLVRTLHDTLIHFHRPSAPDLQVTLQAFADELAIKKNDIAYIRLTSDALPFIVQALVTPAYIDLLETQDTCDQPKYPAVTRLHLRYQAIHDVCMHFQNNGFLRVGVLVKSYPIYWDIFRFSLLILALLGLSISLIYWLSHYFTEPVKRLAAQLQGILKHSPLLIFVQDAEGHLQQTSQQFCQVFAQPADKTDLNIYSLLRKNEAAQLYEMDKQVFAHNKVLSKDVYFHIKQELRHFFMIKFPIIKNRAGHTLLMGSIGVDTTSSRVTERTLWEYARRLEVSNRELQDFAYIASHDLQEPLRKIIAFSDRLQAKYQAELPDPAQDYLQRMRNAAERMQLLIENLLLYSRVTTRAQPFESVDLNQLIQEVLSDLEARLDETQGVVQVQPLPLVNADPTQMRQLFQNLIGNGLKFHKPNRPARVRIYQLPLEDAINNVTITTGELDPTATNKHCIVVEDNGIGFDEKYAARIFNIFQRLHGRNQNYAGTGVGLAICRKIIERHGGTITAQAKAGKGARFIVTLPAEPLKSS